MVWIPTLVLFHFSLVANSLAPLLRFFQTTYELGVRSVSWLPTVSLGGTVVSNIFIGAYYGKIGLTKTLILGSVLSASGTLLLGFSRDLTSALLGFLLIGFSNGFGFTGSTMLLVEGLGEGQNEKRSQVSSALGFGIYHGGFGLGGVVAPVLITFAERLTGDPRAVYLFYFVHLTLIFTILVLKLSPERFRESSSKKNENAEGRVKLKQALRSKTFVLPLIMLTLYSSAEIGTITWAGVLSAGSESHVRVAYALFWLLFTFGRFALGWLAPLFERFFSFVLLVLIVTVGLFLYTGEPLMFALSGLLFGPIFPYIQSEATGTLDPKLRSMFNGTAYALTALGGNAMVLLMGAIGEILGRLTYALPLVLLMVLFRLHSKPTFRTTND